MVVPAISRTRSGWIVLYIYHDFNKVKAFIKYTTQQHCQLLIFGNSRKYDYGDFTVTHRLYVRVSLQLGEATIHWAHSLEPTIGSECLHKSFALFIGLFPLAIAFELLLLCDSSGNSASFCTFVFHFLH